MAINHKLLNKTLKRIESDYHHFDMNVFKRTIKTKLQMAFHYITKGKYKEPLECGTICCFAGEAVIAAKGYNGLKRTPYDKIANTASKLLGFTDTPLILLFYPDDRAYPGISQLRKGTKAYARCVVKGIRTAVAEYEASQENA